jgi:hypothetical protein
VNTDNTTALSYLNKEGGTRSLPLCQLALEIFQWAEQNQTLVKAVYIKGELNVQADALSRFQVPKMEWSLSTGTVDRLFSTLQECTIDLFASDQNHRLPRFCSLQRSQIALAQDAFSISWTGEVVLAFPPFSLIPRFLVKLQKDRARGILIAPDWPRQLWYSRLLTLLEAQPVRLRPLADQLWHPMCHDHLSPVSLQLTAWLLSAGP